MAWFRVDDKLHDHQKVRRLRDAKLAALGLWAACGSWAADNLSDGFVPAEIVRRFDADEQMATRLVEVGLWEATEEAGEDGYRFHEWDQHQPTKAEVERRRDEAKERMRRLRAGKKDSSGVRANFARSAANVREHPDANTPEDQELDENQTALYVVSNTEPQVDDSVRANTERTSHEVRDPVPAPSTTKHARKKSKTPFPENWAPTDTHRQFCAEAGLNVTTEANKFRSKSLANDWRYVRWDQAFTNWLHNAVEFRQPRGQRAAAGHDIPPNYTGPVMER